MQAASPALTLDPDIIEAAANAAAWPFEEARKLVARLEKSGKTEVLFETGYGPSGLPHIGTFGEVARTSMVRHAFRVLTRDAVPTRLIAFSDDMDGLRKVPDNVPNREMLAGHLNQPLTRVPDPFGTHDSFGAHNNAELRRFLDAFGFAYEFRSATECYRSGVFDATLLRVLERYDAVMEIMLPSLRAERSASYSPFLPLHPVTGHVMQVPIDAVNAGSGTIAWRDPATGERYETPVTGGHAKLQWKPDWAMRWVALGVDYEMAGKDLIDSVKLSAKIARALGGEPPEGFNYELFLDEKGQKISKSKGNGLSIDEWLTYASTESLSYYMFQKPKTAKRLSWDVIPKAVDEYHQQLRAFPTQDAKAQLANPVWHIHSDSVVPQSHMVVSFSMLLNLASAAGAEDKETMWGFIRRYAPDATPKTHPDMDDAAGFAVRYYNDFVKPTKQFRAPDEKERAAMEDLAGRLRDYDGEVSDEALQTLVFSVGKDHAFENLRDWFKALYEVLLGQSQGPRFGGFVALYGVDETVALIEKGLAGELG